MENTIIEWIENPNRDYREGVEMFIALGGNRFQARYFSATMPKYAMNKLVYELKKLAKSPKALTLAKATVPNVQQPVSNNQQQEDNGQVNSDTQQPDPNGKQEEKGDIGAIAKRIIHETWVEMARITEELFQLGTSNDEESIKKRKALLDERLPLIERYNQVYEAKESFYAGEMTAEQLFTIVMGKPEQEQAPDFSKLSDIDLMKRIHSAKTAIGRANNQLLYQQDKKGDTENPMPECPKRTEWEQRLAVRTAELDGLLMECEKRGISNSGNS